MSRTFVADEMIGRALFGIAAVLFWVFLIAVARQGWRKLFAARDIYRPPPARPPTLMLCALREPRQSV